MTRASSLQRSALSIAFGVLFAATMHAQVSDLRNLPPEVLAFSFTAPAQPQVVLTGWDGILLPDHGFNYVTGPVAVDWNRINLDWRFIWHANTAAVTSVRWELSKSPFPASGDFVPAPGFGLTGQETSNTLLVDLNLLAPRPPNWTPKLAIQGLTGSFGTPGIVLPPTELTPTRGVTRLSALNFRFTGANIPDPSNATVQAFKVHADPVIAQSMSLYMRVVPLNAAGVAIGPPSNAVTLDFFDPDPTNVIATPHFVHPSATFAGYTAVRPYNFNWGCHVVITADAFGIYHKGDKLDICDDDSDFVGDVVDAFTDVFDFVASFVDWVSDAYSDVKNAVASKVAEGLQNAGIPCNETCVSIAMNTALAAAGMPPELPDVEQLQAMGEGYVVDAVANYAEAQGVPVPEEAREKMREQIDQMLDDAATAMFTGGEGSGLYIPDITYQFHGPILVIDMANPSNHFVSMTDPLRVSDQTGRYHTETFFVPPIRPGGHFRIALTLDPVDDPKAWMSLMPGPNDSPFMAGYFEKLAAAENALEAWRAKYRTNDLALKVTVGPYDAFTAILPAKN